MAKRTIFQTPPSRNLINVGLLAVRLGLGAGFLWAGINKVADPPSFGMMMQDEEHSKQMFQDSISTPMQKHQFTEKLMETLDSDSELRMHVMAHLMQDEDFMKEMSMPMSSP